MYQVYSYGKQGNKVIEKRGLATELAARQFIMWVDECEWNPPYMYIEKEPN